MAALKQARGQGDSWQLHSRQIYAMYQAAMKAAQIEPEVRAFAGKFPNERARWVNYHHIGHAYVREGDPLRAARALVPALAHAGADGSMAMNYVQWLVDKAVAELNTAAGVKAATEKSLEAARLDEKKKLDTFNKLKDPNAKKTAKTTYDAAVKVRQALEEL